MTKPSVQILTVEEVAKHNTKRDAWIIIDDGVYDITNFGKHHPGGAVIYQYAGLDATDAFYAFHYDSEAEKRLRMLKVGTLCSSSTHVSPVLQDFRALRKQVEEAKLMEPTLWDTFKCSIPYLTLYIGGYWLFSLLPYSMWTVLFCSMVVGLGLGQGGFVQHDLGHNSGFKHASKYNYPWQIVAFNIMIGASAGWWRGRHNRHHAFPNHEDVDLDMRTLPLFAWDDDQLCRAYQKGLKNVKYQHWYFTFFGPPLVFILYRVLLTQWLIRTRSWAEIGAVTFYWIWSAAVLLPKMEYQILPFVIWQLIKLLVSGTYLGWVFALNHTPFPVVKGKKMNWVEQTCATTQNIVPASENSPWTQFWLDWFSGHLNYQVEHHLFPGMPRCNYSKLKPLLQPLLKKHDVPYHEANFFQAVGQVFEALRKTAETGIKKAAKSPGTIQERLHRTQTTEAIERFRSAGFH